MTLPPGPRAPAAINLVRYVSSPVRVLSGWRARYGDLFTLRLTFFGTGVYIADPEAIRELFTAGQDDLLAGEANSFLTPMLGPGSLLALDGHEHLEWRRALLPSFTGEHVAGYRELIREVAQREIAGWRPGRRLVLRDEMRRVTFEVMCRAVLGVSDRLRIDRIRNAVVALIDSSPLYLLVSAARADRGPLTPGHWYARRVQAVDRLLRAEIALGRTDPCLEQRTDLLARLLCRERQTAVAWNDTELRDQLLTMIVAGYETTATATASAFELLLHNPGTLARLRAELADGSSDAYLEAVVKETLRLRPVIDNVERTLARPRRVAGFDLPAGIKLYPGIVLVHLREDVYPRAGEFRPERFLDAPGEPYTWLPFGGGTRRCMGAAMAQTEIAEVLRAAIPAVSLRALRDRPDPVVLKGITLAPRHGVQVEVAG